MNLFQKIFSKPKIDCPRCLGKGDVDWEDIKRLKNELKWLPGKCAYCNGTGKVDEAILSKVSANNPYLNLDIAEEERQKLLVGDSDALKRANYYNTEVDGFIKQVEYLYFIGKLDLNQIVDFYLVNNDKEVSSERNSDLYDYINKIIEYKKAKP